MNERLTTKLQGGTDAFGMPLVTSYDLDLQTTQSRIKARCTLGRIEDILYAPDGTQRVTLDDLRALVDAWEDGRAVVLPCKPGDPVWHVVYEPDYLDFRIPPRYGIRKDEFHLYDLPQIGKTIFLTLNEAVASRKKLMRSESAEAAKGEQK